VKQRLRKIALQPPQPIARKRKYRLQSIMPATTRQPNPELKLRRQLLEQMKLGPIRRSYRRKLNFA
jgi:hypothetical protein